MQISRLPREIRQSICAVLVIPPILHSVSYTPSNASYERTQKVTEWLFCMQAPASKGMYPCLCFYSASIIAPSVDACDDPN